uniref:NADH dehydrogenase subunit 3 n=1 Tax=Xestocephalus biprocessus TaxID=3112134 RepID=UPI002E76524C|nr:NADH dehydrogenase subunit 3 [Xestocephalus biprocessus]WRK21290.1 NADH dehydrogenase subunit 3 [Xestocephalus biprocessus]
MNLITKFSLMSMALIYIMMMLITTINMKSINDHQKSSPFECGFNPISHSRNPFSIKFFLIGVIFLIFDIEIIIVMPMIITMKSSMIMNWTYTSILILIILITGLYHEWYNGMLNWTT